MDKTSINIIASRANNVKKPNKTLAFAIIKKIIDNGEADDNDLVDLYSFFLPPVPAKPKTDKDWILKAMAKKDVRYYLNYIYVLDGRMMATDGHRLHFCNADLENGFYDTALIKVDVDGNYPDVSKVIPDTAMCKSMSLPGSFPLVDSDGVQAYNIVDDLYCAKTYIDQALCGLDNPTIHYTDKNSSVLITTDGNRCAVVMPIRMH